jgi:hypothetical protein
LVIFERVKFQEYTLHTTTLRQQFIILTLLTCWASDLRACDCGSLDKISAVDFEKAGEIFIGKAIRGEEEPDGLLKAVTFEVEEQLKPTESKREITIWTARDEAACGLSIKVGDKWYIFSYYNGNGQLCAGFCGRSVNLGKKYRIRDYGFKYAFLEKMSWKKDIKRYRHEKRFIRKLTTASR